jgi:prolyl-tRNA editing enzyme YbaK/EbsC (Cys-tRNA(Pro) deacylase)
MRRPDVQHLPRRNRSRLTRRTRPEASMSDDAEIEARVAAALERLGAAWELMRIDPGFADTAAFCEKYGVPLDHSGNAIIVASKKEPKKFCACLVLATTRLDVNHTVRRLMDVSRVSFATADETMALTGMMIGGVTLLALPPEVPIYVDDRIMALDYVILGGGSRSSKLKLAPDVLRRVPNLTVVPGLAMASS